MRERERRYDVAEDFAMPDLGAVNGVAEVTEPEVQRLEATYFDTPDHRLGAADVTLRRQTGGDDAGWHLELPAAVEPAARHDLRVGPGRAVRTVPKRLRTTVSGLTGEQALSPLAILTTQRALRRLVDEDGTVLAEIADDSVEAVLVPGGDDGAVEDAAPVSTASWREVDVELVEGSPDLLKGVGKQLGKAGAHRSGRRPKPVEFLAGPLAKPVAPVRGKDPVQLLVHHRLSTQLDLLRRRDPLARENLPEGVHKMRVAVRRLRSALATCRPFLDRSVTDPLRDELGWLSDVLGDARDAEVRRARLDQAIDALVQERPGLDWDADRARPALSANLADRHERAHATLEEALGSDRHAALLDRLRELVAEPPWSERAAKKVRGAYRRRVERELRRVQRRMESAGDSALTPEARAAALHEARKAAKRARYAIEPLRPVYGRSAKTLTNRLKKLQSELGLHQDTVVTRSYLHDLTRASRPSLDPGAALLAGALIERESVAAEHYERRAAKASRKVAASPSPE